MQGCAKGIGDKMYQICDSTLQLLNMLIDTS
ncbi:hypothetical protein PANT111_90120 [Pantoea brenneri]|uniref:Uncharacterized protein n=1 Tax=Pantoea brenneri TaxID=472694 RepID=A0AAX3JD09_9GAMM|nr:hypothetical protein PANT111_90120 [Pantoea brenneri]